MSAPENPPAFPVSDGIDTNQGMTLRDWFAGQALTGLNANKMLPNLVMVCEKEGLDFDEAVAKLAYGEADAMLAQRERGQ